MICDDNYEYIGKMSSLIEVSATSNLIVLGEFNAAVNSVFKCELLKLCKTYQLVVSNHVALGQDSKQYKYLEYIFFVLLLGSILFDIVKIFRTD